MGERSRIPLIFGAGLDRATGVMAVQPSSMGDLRNVYPLEGKVQARKGIGVGLALEAPGGLPLSHIIAGHALRTELAGVVVGYHSPSRKAHVYRVSGSGDLPEYLGEWFTLLASASEPRALMVDSGPRVFMAHDEPAYPLRRPTYYFDPNAAEPRLKPLMLDLDRSGEPAPARFRGVTRHLGYLVGWGYDNQHAIRPDFVRYSEPGVIGNSGDVEFDPDAYHFLGQQGEAITVCRALGEGIDNPLMAFKANEIHRIAAVGNGEFANTCVDYRFGCLNGHLAVDLDGAVVFWSAEGPRITTGGASEDLAMPLDLAGPSPADLVAEGSAAYGFATYVPFRRLVLFVFGRRVYCLSLASPRNPRWSYWELGVDTYNAFTLYSLGGASDGGGTGLPVAEPREVSDVTTSSVLLEWANLHARNGVTIEVWLQEDGAPWVLHTEIAGNGQTLQEATITGLEVADYQVALRGRRYEQYAPGFAGADPDEWPELARGFFTTRAPELLSGAWERISAEDEQVEFTAIVDPARDVVLLANEEVVHTFEPLDPLVYLLPGDETLSELEVAFAAAYRTELMPLGRRSAVLEVYTGPAGPLPTNLRITGSEPMMDEGQTGEPFQYGERYFVAWDLVSPTDGAGIMVRLLGFPEVSYFNDAPAGGETAFVEVEWPMGHNSAAIRVRGWVETFGKRDYTPASAEITTF
jgi:hypothetical protein